MTIKNRRPSRYGRERREADYAYAEIGKRKLAAMEAKSQAEHFVNTRGLSDAKREAVKNAIQVGSHYGNTRGQRFWLDVADAVDVLREESE